MSNFFIPKREPMVSPGYAYETPTPFMEGGATKLGKDEINGLPLFHYTGKVTLVRTLEDMAAVLPRLMPKGNGCGPIVLGFDTETRPSFRKGKSYSPSLVQLATENEVFLFHLKWLPLGDDLISIFTCPDIIKTGVAVHDDMRFLARLAPFAAQSVVDLSDVARKNCVENRGLRGLAALFLGLRISKGEQCSNWACPELSERQVRYAATDAWASRAVYHAMREAGLDMDASAPEPPATRTKPKTRRRSGRPVVRKA